MTRYPFIKKIRKVGGVLVLTIPSDIIEAGGMKEGDILQVFVEDLNKKRIKAEKAANPEPKRNIPEELKQPVLEALRQIYYDHVISESRESTLRRRAEYKGDGQILGTIPNVPGLWVSYSRIKEYIEHHKYIIMDETMIKNIYVDIGKSLSLLGFLEVQRNNSGTHRYIKIEELSKLIEIEIPDLDDHEYKPKVEFKPKTIE